MLNQEHAKPFPSTRSYFRLAFISDDFEQDKSVDDKHVRAYSRFCMHWRMGLHKMTNVNLSSTCMLCTPCTLQWPSKF